MTPWLSDADIEAICAAGNVKLVWNETDKAGMATPASRAVYIPRIRDVETLLVALHELGHVLGEPAHVANKQEYREYMGQDEANAWLWALENVPVMCDEIVTPILYRLNSYFQMKEVYGDGGYTCEEWCLVMDLLGCAYDPVLNRYDRRENL